MQIYLLYSKEDATFAEKLSHDLQISGIQHARADMNTDERFSALHQADKVIVVLSAYTSADARVLATLSAAHDLQLPLLAVRRGNIPEMPRYLKGVLPIDFSNDDYYDESLQSLIGDIAPPTLNINPLPPELLKALQNIHDIDPQERKIAIERLGKLRDSRDSRVRDAAKTALSEIAFKDHDPTTKRLAGIALQAFDEPRTSTIKSTPPTPAKVADMLATTEDKPIDISDLAQTDTIQTSSGLWQTRTWWMVIAVGVVMGLLHGLAAANSTLALTLMVLVGVLGWVNVQIRAGGEFVWRMPAPMIGNGLMGILLALVVGGLGSLILTSLTLPALVALVALGGLYGALLGWLSSL